MDVVELGVEGEGAESPGEVVVAAPFWDAAGGHGVGVGVDEAADVVGGAAGEHVDIVGEHVVGGEGVGEPADGGLRCGS